MLELVHFAKHLNEGLLILLEFPAFQVIISIHMYPFDRGQTFDKLINNVDGVQGYSNFTSNSSTHFSIFWTSGGKRNLDFILSDSYQLRPLKSSLFTPFQCSLFSSQCLDCTASSLISLFRNMFPCGSASVQSDGS